MLSWGVRLTIVSYLDLVGDCAFIEKLENVWRQRKVLLRLLAGREIICSTAHGPLISSSELQQIKIHAHYTSSITLNVDKHREWTILFRIVLFSDLLRLFIMLPQEGYPFNCAIAMPSIPDIAEG